jgi:predicted metal-binding membrane protein
MSFLVQHWGGKRAAADALRLGFHHGAYCVGCCWSLMLLMFAVATGGLGWMLLLGIVMAAEKNLPWGRKLSAPLGVVLIVAAVGIAAGLGR